MPGVPPAAGSACSSPAEPAASATSCSAILSMICPAPGWYPWPVTARCPSGGLDEVTYVRGDVRNTEQMTAVMQDFRPDLVIHLAAQRSPALAERRVAETVSTNIVGSQVVLETAERRASSTVVMASTGKAVRLFTGDVYAAPRSWSSISPPWCAKRYEMNVSCTRFTHVVDNSIVGQNILSPGSPRTSRSWCTRRWSSSRCSRRWSATSCS